jgi:hypothetical protein
VSYLEIGRRVVGLKALSYADSESGASNFAPDSYVLLFGDDASIIITSATDWTLEVEPGTWPSLPNWAWPPESWRFEDADSPLGSPGFDVIRGLAEIRNEVGEVVGVEVTFDRGTLRLRAGDSVSYSLDTR